MNQKVDLDGNSAPFDEDKLEKMKVNSATLQTPKFIGKIESCATLLNEPEPKQERLVADIIQKAARGLVIGEPGVGKTFFVICLAIAILTRRAFLEFFEVHHSGPCLLIEEESSRLNLARRFHALKKGMGFESDELSQLYFLVRSFMKITDPTAEKELIQFIREKKIVLVIFDSFRRFHDRKENSSEELQPVLDAFARIQHETGSAIILIHHLNKDSQSKRNIFERARGSSDLWAWRDFIIAIEGEAGTDEATCHLQFRDYESPPPFSLTREVTEHGGVILRRDELKDKDAFREAFQALEVEMKAAGIIMGSKSKITRKIKGVRRQILLSAFNKKVQDGTIKKCEGGYLWEG